MNLLCKALLCLCTVFLCSCGLFGAKSKTKKKSSKPDSERSLGQRMDRPNLEKRSRYEKMMTSGGDRNIGSHFQKQMHHSGRYGTKSFGGQTWHKVNYASGLGASSYANNGFSQAGKGSQIGNKSFEAAMSREGQNMSRENSNFAREGGQVFGTDPALTKNERVGKFPKIIENRPNGSGAGEKTYSEDEIIRLLGRP